MRTLRKLILYLIIASPWAAASGAEPAAPDGAANLAKLANLANLANLAKSATNAAAKVAAPTAPAPTEAAPHEAATAAPAADSAAMKGRLPEVTVNARSRFREVIPAQTLSGKAIEALRSHSVADALRYFSGVQIKDYGGVGGIKTVDMRSMGTNHMGVFYDGIQLGNAQNGQIDLGKFSLDNIEAIDMYNGQKSDIFQSARDFGSAGTLYLQSRRPRFDGDRRYNANVTFRTGSFGLVNPSARFDYKLSESVSGTVSAEYTYATGKYKFRYRKLLRSGAVAWDTTATRQNGDLHALRVEAGLYGNIRRGYWQAKLYFYDSERGIPGAIVNNVWKNSQRQWDRNFFAQGRFQKSFSRLYSLQVNAKYARDYMRYLNPDTTLMLINNRFWQDELYVSAANRFRIFPWLDLNASADYQWNYLNSTLMNFAYPTRHTLLGAVAAAITLGPLKGQASLLGTYVNDRGRVPNTIGVPTVRTNSYRRLTPAVFLSWKPFPAHDLNLRAFFKRIFRMPTFNDLFYTDIGNADLRPEFATQWNLGVVWHRGFSSTWLESIDLTADAYYNRISDKIIAVPKGTGQYRWMMMNIGKVRIRGVDVTGKLNFRPLPSLLAQLRLNYTFQRAQDYSDPNDCRDEAGTYKGQIAYIPRHSGSVAFNAQWRTAELNYSFIYVGERYHTSSNIPANYEPAWYTHDISASYRFLLPRHLSLKVTLEVNNLFDQQFEVIHNYPMPGRNFQGILSFDI